MSAALDAVAAGDVACFGLSVAWPGATRYYAAAPYTSAVNGHHQGKVLSWGQINYRLSDRSGRLAAVETRVTIDDTDRSIARIYAGSSANLVRGVVASIYVMTPSVSSVETVFAGVVSKVSFPSPFVAELTLRTKDDQLQRKAPRGGWALTAQTWPNADPAVYNKTAPLLYGTFDSSQVRTGPGLIPTLLVDKVLFRYLVCAGKAKTLTRVFVDGVEVAGATYGSAFDYVTRHGRIYSCITFTADKGTSVITCDAVGYEAVGDGTGAVITNPVTQMEHLLSNFVLADYKTGSWLSTHSLIGSLTTVRNYLGANGTGVLNLGASGSYYQDDFRTGLDVIAAFCTSWRCLAYWTKSGTLSLGMEDVFATPYAGTRLRWYRDERWPFSFVDDDWTVTSRIVARQFRSPVDDSYLSSVEIVDASVDTNETQESIDLEWSASA